MFSDCSGESAAFLAAAPEPPQVSEDIAFTILHDGPLRPPKPPKPLPRLLFISTFGFFQASPKHKRPNWGQEQQAGSGFLGV